ncbi:MAG: hypothetical protein ACLQRM_16535 [Acidimicrobiales bacterium]|jgi:hypothetical protein
MELTIFGAIAVSFMMVMYALESRSQHFIAAFALGCALSSTYGFLAGTWPFGVVEAVWSLVALRRYHLRSGICDTSVSPAGPSGNPGVVLGVGHLLKVRPKNRGDDKR